MRKAINLAAATIQWPSGGNLTEFNNLQQIEDFNEDIARQWFDAGYYAVAVQNDALPRAQGYDATYAYPHVQYGLRKILTVYVGTRDHPLMVEHRGFPGFQTWTFIYRFAEPIDYWVRWGRVVLFVPEWNELEFGQVHTVRNIADFPGWLFPW